MRLSIDLRNYPSYARKRGLKRGYGSSLLVAENTEFRHAKNALCRGLYLRAVGVCPARLGPGRHGPVARYRNRGNAAQLRDTFGACRRARPVPKVWLIGDDEINAFASYGEGGENIFIFSGILLWLHTPNELIGVMAHETGHISAGHLSRGSYGIKKAMIPMLLSMVVGLGAMIAGAGAAGEAIMRIGPGLRRRSVRGLHPGAGIHR